MRNDGSILNGKKYAVWGTGVHYEKHYQSFVSSTSNREKMWGFVDNNREKWGKFIDGHSIHSPEDLVGSDVEIVLIASQSHPDIFQQLCEILYSNVNALKNTYLLYEDNIDMKRIDRAMDEYRYSVGLKKPMSL